MEKLVALGVRLKNERLKRNETQQMFAARVGVSVPTLNKMERGEPTVAIGHWLSALRILGREADLEQILAPSDDLFKLHEQQHQPRSRQRASRKRT